MQHGILAALLWSYSHVTQSLAFSPGAYRWSVITLVGNNCFQPCSYLCQRAVSQKVGLEVRGTVFFHGHFCMLQCSSYPPISSEKLESGMPPPTFTPRYVEWADHPEVMSSHVNNTQPESRSKSSWMMASWRLSSSLSSASSSVTIHSAETIPTRLHLWESWHGPCVFRAVLSWASCWSWSLGSRMQMQPPPLPCPHNTWLSLSHQHLPRQLEIHLYLRKFIVYVLGIWRSGMLRRLSHMPLLHASCFRNSSHFSKIKGMEVKKGAVRL